MKHASIIVDPQRVQCDACGVSLEDDLARVCPVCKADFDSIISGYPGLAAKLKRRREAAGVHPWPTRTRSVPPSTTDRQRSS